MSLSEQTPDPGTSGRRGPEARRERQRREARRAILDASEELLLESGADDFSIRELARSCGYSAPTIYNHFEDKDGVIDALLEERFARLGDAVRLVEPHAEPLQNARRMALAFMRFGRENPAFYRLISSLSRKGRSRTPPAVEQTRERLQKPMDQLAAAGRLRVDPESAAQALWALMHGLTSLQSVRPDYDWAPDLECIALDALLDGLVRRQDGANGGGR